MDKLTKGIVILIIFILVFIGAKVYATTPTLEQIANVFNNCSTVKEYANKGLIWRATNNENKLNISIEANGINENIEYTLDNSILTTNFSENNAPTASIVTVVLTDCIGQLHGYSDGDLFSTLNSDKINSYTVENEGFEIKETTDKNYQMKIDISKKIPLIDAANIYIEVSDLQDVKKYISGDGFTEKNKGNVWFNKNGYGEEHILRIAEKGGLTDNTYKSILSIIEVMFESNKAAEYFKTNYSGMSVGNKEFTGFKIEIDPIKTEFEEKLLLEDSGYKFARITINKSLVKSVLDGTDKKDEKREENNKIENTNKDNNSSAKKQDNTLHTGNLPKTGINTLSIVCTIGVILVVCECYKKYKSYKDIK